MKLKGVAFENFRSFKSRTEIPLTRITYLIGPNGSGKSSVFKGIEALSHIITNKCILDPKNYFEQNWTVPAYLSFTAELSEDERIDLLNRVKKYKHGDMGFVAGPTFQYIKYEVSVMGIGMHREVLSLSDKNKKFHVMERHRRVENSYERDSRNIEYIDLHRMDGQSLTTSSKTKVSTDALLGTLGSETHRVMMKFWSDLALVPNTRQSPSTATAKEVDTISYDCADLPNVLRTLDNDKKQTRALENLIRDISSKEIEHVNVQILERNHVITAGVKCLETPVDWDMLSSGEQNMIMLAYIRHSADATIVMIEEPELHLHAKAQKELRRIMCERTENQMIVETHSPIFANVSDDESVVLLTKDNGTSGAVRVDASNCNLLRMEMGISHTDAVDNDHLCLVEGESEHIAIPVFAKTMGYEMGLAPWTWSLGGQGNTKNIGVLLQYLSTSERTMFLLLDAHSEARIHVDEILKKGLLQKDQCHFLKGNFEDLFPVSMLIEHTRKLAQEKGVDFAMTEQELEAAKQGCSVIEVLDKEWKRLTQEKYPKADLAKSLTVLDRNEIPDEVAEVVRIVMDKFGMVEPSRDRGSR